MITENLSTLKIHKLTQEQYDREVEAGNIDNNALYLTPDNHIHNASDVIGLEDIISAMPSNTILYIEQNLDSAQQAQARANIGAGTVRSVNGVLPDKNGNVRVVGGGGAATYTVRLDNLLDSRTLIVPEGKEAVLKLSYSSVDSSGVNDGSGVGNIIVGGTVRKTFTAEQGTIEMDVAEYLSVGTTDVTVKVTNSEGIAKTVVYSITVESLSITSSFDAATPYSGNFAFPYIPVGISEKTIHFEVDGDEIGTATVTTSGRQQSYTIPAQSHGTHVLRVWITCVISETELESNVLHYGIICTEEGNNTPIIAITTPPAEEAEQYSNLVTKYRVYNPSSLSAEITLEANGETVGSFTVDRTEQTWSYRHSEVGDLEQIIRCGDVYSKWNVNITESSVKVDAETEYLALHLTSYGRSNNEANPGVWESNDISAEFTGFNFVTDGWVLDDDNITVLRVSGDARLNIPYQIFATDFRNTGKTLEFELATREVLDYDAEVLTCYSGNRGFKITAQQLIMASEQSTTGTRYKEDEHIRVSIVAEKKTENRLLLCYINGIMSGAVQYPADDDFSQNEPVGITVGSNDCTVDLYNIRAYDNSLTRYQILDNWIADTQDYGEKTDRFKRNSVYDEYGRITISKLPADLPYLVLQGPELPQFKGDKKTISGYFVDPMNPKRNFTVEDAQIDVQGTSSQYYYVKNFKIKGQNGFIIYDGSTIDKYQMNDDAVPVNTFTMKADVASSEGAFNAVLAMIYDDLCTYKTPAQKADARVRQTIEGFPIVIFWENGNEKKFIGKYNFNNDKGTAEVFGFKNGDESWEILQNGTDRVGWHSADFSGNGWKDDFEARFPEKNTDTTRLQALAEWLVSTDTDQATGNAITPVTYGDVEYSTDTKEYRLAKFSAELADHFVEEALIFYYLFTEIFLCIDQREKNAFPTYIKSLDRWIVLFYDADSSLGTDNKGNLTFDYYLEDIDYTEGGEPVYNGQNSVLWKNLRETRYDEIMSMYQDFRTKSKISYESVIGRFEEHQSKWPEAIFNEDMYRKCIEPLVESGDGLYLPMLQGKKEQWMKWWLYNRFRYLDSKYCTGTAMTNRITIRTHAPANITLSSYVNMYGHVFYNNEHVQQRMMREQEYEFVSEASGAEDRVIGINDADMLTDLGDLSPHIVELIDVSKATHITNLKLGDSSESYANYSLNSITLGNNILLKTLDVRNCPNLTQTVDVSGCTNIEEVYFDGTSIAGVTLSNGGILKKLHLPGTITNLTIRNQTSITDFVLPNYSNITTLRLENVSDAIPDADILAAIPANSRVRLIGFDWSFDSAADIVSLCDRLDTMRGLDENGNNTDKAQVSGTVRVDNITGGQLSTIKERYPDINVVYQNLTSYLCFFDETGENILQIFEAKNGSDAVYTGITPTKESTPQYEYTFAGWSKTIGGGIDSDALLNVTIDRSVYAVFTAKVRTYKVRFFNESTLLQETIVEYGSNATYTGTEPVKEGEWAFTGWNPEPNNISADTDCYAKFRSTEAVYSKLLDRSISGDYSNDRVESVGDYAFYRCSRLTTADFPLATTIGSSAFYSCSALNSVNIPQATSIGADAFKSCIKLTSIDLPLITSISNAAFASCSVLNSVNIPQATSIGDYSFDGCKALTTADFQFVTSIGSGTFRDCSSLTSVDLPQVTTTLDNIFRNCPNLTSVNMPHITDVASNSFVGCSNLTSANFQFVKSIGQYAFNGCTALTTADLPAATSINSNAFNGCTLLTTLILRNTSKIATLSNKNAFTSTPIASGAGYIYVPRDLVDSYKSATNWSNYTAQFRAIEDYPEICGGDV